MNASLSNISVRYPNDWDMDHCPHVRLTNNTYSYTDPHISIYKDVVMVQGICKLLDNKDLTPNYLSLLWRISLNDDKNTIRATTQRTICNSESINARHFKKILTSTFIEAFGK